MRPVIDPLKARVKEMGLWATHLGPELGGKGFGQVKLALMNEILGAYNWAPTIFGVQGPDTGNAEVLAHYGTEEQKAKYLQPLLEGELFSTFSMTEPQAGADPSYLKTRAVRDGDEWVINGEKFFASNASNAAFIVLLAITDPDVKVTKGASMFLVPTDTPGFEILRQTCVMGGEHDMDTEACTHPHVRFDNVRVPAENLIGAPGEGFLIAQTRLSGGRIHHAMRTIAICQRALDMMCERALSRSSFGSLISEKQTVQQAIADSYAEIQQFRLYVLYTAWQIDQAKEYNSNIRRDIALCKTFAYKLHRDVVERAVHIHGALGCSNEMPLGRMWMEAPTQGVMDGPYEVHQATASRIILRDYRPSPGLWPTEWLPGKVEEASKKHAKALAEQAEYERIHGRKR
ncbi:Acyl-CoA dehydrogenase/oxidase [Aromatoleum petrolei]|nr:Acyl-CoA dehydrogenase/oxidase [Aromatoleum petrolei]